MKKLPTYLTILVSSVLAGCDKYDVQIPQDLETKEFYVANEDKALQVIKKCEQVRNDIEQLYRSIPKSEEKDLSEYLSKFSKETFDKNCENAQQALYTIERQKEEEKRQKERANKEAENYANKIKLLNELKAAFAKYDQLPWQDALSLFLSESGVSYDFYNRNTKYNLDENVYRTNPIEIAGRYNGDDDVDDYEEAKNNMTLPFIGNQLWQKALSELRAKKYDELVSDESYCKKDKRKFSACDVWKQVVSEKRAEIVKNYTVNYDSLKADYNQCVAKLEDYLKSVNVGKYDKDVPDDILKGIYDTEKNIYAKTPCSEAEEALEKLNLNFDHYENLE